MMKKTSNGIDKMLLKSIKQYEIDEMISKLRNDYTFYTGRGLRGSSIFEGGFCFEFALALYKYLKTKGEKPELVFLVGNMKKSDAAWYNTTEFDPTKEHPFHTVVKVRKFYYDINGRLGNKREILSMWYKFRKKKMVVTDFKEVEKYVNEQSLLKDLEELFKNHYDEN